MSGLALHCHLIQAKGLEALAAAFQGVAAGEEQRQRFLFQGDGFAQVLYGLLRTTGVGQGQSQAGTQLHPRREALQGQSIGLPGLFEAI